MTGMSVISAASAAAFALYLVMGVGVLSESPKSLRHRVFFYLNLFFAIWSIAMAFAYSSSGVSWFFWYRISSIGWIFVPVVSLYFFLLLTGKERYLRHRWIIPAMLFIPLLFTIRSFTGNLMASGFVPGPLGNVENHADRSWFYYAFNIYYLVCFLTGLGLVAKWGFTSKSRLQKKQAAMVFWYGLAAVTLGSITNAFFPFIGNQAVPQVGQLFGLVWVFAIWYAMKKYRLLSGNPGIALNEIIERIFDLIILLDPDERILKVNRAVTNALGWKENELLGHPFKAFFYKNLRKEDDEVPDIHEDGDRLVWEVNFITREGVAVPLNCYISPINDDNGELAGFVFIAQELRWYKNLEREISERRSAQEELRKVNEVLEARVAERTRELETLATTDTLTGVYNRRMGLALLEKEIHHARRNKLPCTVCFVDVNDLKVVNDNYGHKDGDELIRRVAESLLFGIRESDFVARMGGDEFLVVLNGCNLENAIIAWAILQKRIDSLAEEIGKPWKISVSHGFAAFQPDSDMTSEELIATADHAMYQNKKAIKLAKK